jgi:hypothetical protein
VEREAPELLPKLISGEMSASGARLALVTTAASRIRANAFGRSRSSMAWATTSATWGWVPEFGSVKFTDPNRRADLNISAELHGSGKSAEIVARKYGV